MPGVGDVPSATMSSAPVPSMRPTRPNEPLPPRTSVLWPVSFEILRISSTRLGDFAICALICFAWSAGGLFSSIAWGSISFEAVRHALNTMRPCGVVGSCDM
jgi:hypothetical protein